jgi:hypothetical protein
MAQPCPIATNTAHAALAVHTLYFWPQPEKTLAEIARELHPVSRLVLACRGGTHPAPRRFDPNVYRMYPARA